MEQKPLQNQWHGIDRNLIDRYPVIDESKCTWCGLCFVTCGRGVYGYDTVAKKSKVQKPMMCMVGCQTCSNLCPVGAINFAKWEKDSRERAQELLKQRKIFQKLPDEVKAKLISNTWK